MSKELLEKEHKDSVSDFNSELETCKRITDDLTDVAEGLKTENDSLNVMISTESKRHGDVAAEKAMLKVSSAVLPSSLETT